MAAVRDVEVMKIIRDKFKDFEGDGSEFYGACGALVMGTLVGWQGMRMTMSAATFRKHERILGLKFREVLPARTRDSKRVAGVRMADKIGKFWQALSSGFILTGEGKIVDAG